MSEKHCWSDIGTFRPYKMCLTRPDPAEVLHFYLEKRGIEPDEQVAYLRDILDLQKSMVYTILKGEGLDTISRCRQLVKALRIPPPLLGLDAKYYPIEHHMCWREKHGFSFHADAQGYTVVSEVIAYLRMQRTQIDGKGRVKVWSQEDLGDATGLQKETIYRTEHDQNPLIMENMNRRAVVASALGIGTGYSEPTLFRLFALQRDPDEKILRTIYTRKMREEELESQNHLLSYWQPTELESKNPLPSCTLLEKHSWVAPVREGLAEPSYHIGARLFLLNWGMCVKSFIRL